MYHCIPPSNLWTNLYPGDTDTVKFISIPVRCSLKIIPLAISVSMKMLSNDIISTGFGEWLYPSHNIVSLNPKRFLILSSNTKAIFGPCGDISIIDPNVEKFGLILNDNYLR